MIYSTASVWSTLISMWLLQTERMGLLGWVGGGTIAMAGIFSGLASDNDHGNNNNNSNSNEKKKKKKK